MKNIVSHSGEVFIEKSYIKLFIRFLRYGLLAWGGPIAQLALIEKEMVYEEKLISIQYFNRLIAVYQTFPGPETHEICVHLGTQAKGFLGGLLAGLGFMLPGFILAIFVSWLYKLYGITAIATSILLGIKPAVSAWICKGGVQLGHGILISPLLWLIAMGAFFAELYQVNFIITFIASGGFYVLCSHISLRLTIKRTVKFIIKYIWIIIALVSIIVGLVFLFYFKNIPFTIISEKASIVSTFIFGFKCGSLSFGSVYTILSIIKTEAIIKNNWLTQSQFIDGLALTGILPAPFIIVTTFVGYLAYGFWGGVFATLGTFLVPTVIPIFGHKYLNRIGTSGAIRTLLDGITAGVAGLIAADMFDILKQVLINPLTISIFICSLLFIYFYKSTYAIIWIVLIGGLLGVMLS
ncbi:MAG TPA: chromate efflux transporter [Candidatus Babeliales bacterium]|nr:chromate efflux transporter [Candidatus Babeliales bacterium]